jgi:predicted AAA+ superfamily ATPase
MNPKRFLAEIKDAVILDEAQKVPELFSDLQVFVDKNPHVHIYITGSQNFLLLEKITQSLSGRVGIVNLYPLSYAERCSIEVPGIEEFIYSGGYPGVVVNKIPPHVFFNSYLQTYIERDVRLIKNIGDLSTFTNFIYLCAGRIGQPLNLSGIAVDAGVSVNTVKTWLSILEASYMIYFIQPYFENYKKRITKSPKMYFFDTGLLCFLLGITSAEQISSHYAYGHLFENAIITELYKSRTNQGKRPQFWYWKHQHGAEVDLLIQEEGKIKALEIKSSKTYNDRLFSGLKFLQSVAGKHLMKSFCIYGGTSELETEYGFLIPWNKSFTSV